VLMGIHYQLAKSVSKNSTSCSGTRAEMVGIVLACYRKLAHSVQSFTMCRYPDDSAGQIPMAYIVRKPGQEVNEDEVMEWVTKQVIICFSMILLNTNTQTCNSNNWHVLSILQHDLIITRAITAPPQSNSYPFPSKLL
jgi:hypothetical protein